jgi:hypothetical protein
MQIFPVWLSALALMTIALLLFYEGILFFTDKNQGRFLRFLWAGAFLFLGLVCVAACLGCIGLAVDHSVQHNMSR